MPSQYDTFRSTQAKINADVAFNRPVTRSRIGGTNNTNITGFTSVATASGFTGSSNDGINDALITGTGPIALSLGYVSGSLIGDADEVRKLVEVSVDNRNIANYDGINGKATEREVSINASGIRILRDGSYVSTTGAVLTPPFGVVLAGSGSDENLLSGRSTALDYGYRYALSNTEKTLNLRSQ